MKKFDLQPKNRDKITLFANKAEAIVFWLAVAGLIFLAIVSLFRYLSGRQLEAGEQFRREMNAKIMVLEQQNRHLQNRLDSLEAQIREMQAATPPE